jgi:putative inorganic carbon (HCO3(-)) transporter
LTVEAFVEGAAALGASGAAGTALVLDAPRARARSMVAALVLAAVALEPLVWPNLSDQIDRRAAVVGAGALIGVAAIVVLVLVVRRRLPWLGLLVFAALPFRVPLSIGGDTANLLAPLYVVILAGCLALAFGVRQAPERAPPKAVVRLDRALAVVLVLYALQALYSADLEQAVKNICFFYVPFAVLYRLLREIPWTRELLIRCLYVIVGLALLFAAIGFGEFASKHLLISNAKVLHANEIKPYFRVNSLFFDPNIYGRFLALTMIALATRLLWSERGRQTALLAAALAVLWAGLVLSLSQSSFAALLVGLAVLAALRWRALPVVLVTGAVLGAALAVVLISPKTVGLKDSSTAALDTATSGRAGLITGGTNMFADRPVWGFGSGAFQEQYRKREHIASKRIAAVSHTIPITVAAEQGVIGLVAYLLLLIAAIAMLFGGLRTSLLGGRAPPTEGLVRVVCATGFVALVVHTLIYASFLEDPLTWVLLGLAATLRARPQPPAAPAAS